MKNSLLAIHSKDVDSSLVKKYLAGDKNVLNQLIQKYQPFIYNVA
jgi:hypothetical protein